MHVNDCRITEFTEEDAQAARMETLLNDGWHDYILQSDHGEHKAGTTCQVRRTGPAHIRLRFIFLPSGGWFIYDVTTGPDWYIKGLEHAPSMFTRTQMKFAQPL